MLAVATILHLRLIPTASTPAARRAVAVTMNQWARFKFISGEYALQELFDVSRNYLRSTLEVVSTSKWRYSRELQVEFFLPRRSSRREVELCTPHFPARELAIRNSIIYCSSPSPSLST
jgi:hypothetical protein